MACTPLLLDQPLFARAQRRPHLTASKMAMAGDMSLSHEQVSALVKAVLLERPESLRLGGVSSAESGRGRIEVFIMLEGCHDAPCVLSLNLARTSRAQLERELQDELTRALNRHLANPRR